MYLVVFPQRDMYELICSTSSPVEQALPSCNRPPQITWQKCTIRIMTILFKEIIHDISQSRAALRNIT